jgi:integration host factor subunit beta
MNKADMITALAQKENLTTKDAAEIINTILISITGTLKNGENVEIRGFGSFSIREYNSYTGRNPKTGEKITVKPKKMPFFKPGKDLRNAVNSLK